MHLPKLPLRVKLLLFFVLVSTLPLLINNFIWFNASQTDIIRQTSKEITTVQQKAKANISGFFTKKLVALVNRAQSQAFLTHNLPVTTVELKNLLTQDPTLQQIQFFDANGQELIKINRKQVFTFHQGGSHTPSPSFDAISKQGINRYISAVYLNNNNVPTIDLAIPVLASSSAKSTQGIVGPALYTKRQPGELLGILVAKVNIKTLWKALDSFKISQSGYVYVVDAHGNIMYHPGNSFLNHPQNLSSIAEVKNFISTLSDDTKMSGPVNQTTDEMGKLSLTSYERAPLTNWGVIAEVPLTDTLAAISRVFFFVIILFLISLTFVILLSLEISKQILKPIKQLQQGTNLIGMGNLDYHLTITSGDEIEELGNAFNKMAKNLHDAFGRLEQDTNIINGEKNKMAITLESIADAIIVVDNNRNIIVFNKRAEEITGYSQAEALGKPINTIVKLFDKDEVIADTTFCPVSTYNTDGIVFQKKDLKLLSRDDKEHFANIIVGHIKDGFRINFGASMTLHDITEERALEEMKQDFVSIAAHELRTPLTALAGYLSVFIQENESKFSTEQNMFLKRIDTATKQLMGLIENLLNVSRIERGVLTVAIAPMDWTTFVKQIVTEFSERAKQKNISLTFTEPVNNLPPVLADKMRIGEVLSNIIANAINYTPDNGHITVSLEVKDNEVVTHVQDTGTGIPQEAITKLFTKFFRVEGELGKGSKGTGLGLYISKAIITMHKGHIWVDSKVGEGSIFSFSLPIAGKI